MKRSTLLSALAAAAAIAPGRAAVAQTATALPIVRMAAIPVDISAEIFYAKETGFFRKAGIDADITPMRDGGTIASAILANAIDIGYTGEVEIAAARERGLKLAILAPASMHVTGNPTATTIAVLATSSIHTAKDLSGKTVGVSPLRGSPWLAMSAWLDKNGGDSTKVNFIEMGLSTMPDAIKAGRVDAALLDSLGAATVGKPGDPLRAIGCANDGIAKEFCTTVWACSGDWLAKNPELARKFAIAIRETAIWANVHHAESADILTKYTKMTAAQLATINRATYGVDITPAMVQPMIDAAAKYGVIPKAYPAKELLATVPKV